MQTSIDRSGKAPRRLGLAIGGVMNAVEELVNLSDSRFKKNPEIYLYNILGSSLVSKN